MYEDLGAAPRCSDPVHAEFGKSQHWRCWRVIFVCAVVIGIWQIWFGSELCFQVIKDFLLGVKSNKG
jgi:hypothetical protein